MIETRWFHDRSIDEAPRAAHDRILARRAAFWTLLLAAALIAAFAWSDSKACDAYVVTGYAYHGDREHHYRSLTTGAGCELIRGAWRADAVVFLNSFSKPTLLLGGSWLPVKVGPLSVGAAFGDAMFGYRSTHQLAGGFVAEWLGRDFGADAILIPPVDGVKGGVLWLRAKILRAWEPLK